ncbi:MAG: hypothetical protein AAFV53_12850 [Myxococcota bacterium]
MRTPLTCVTLMAITTGCTAEDADTLNYTLKSSMSGVPLVQAPALRNARGDGEEDEDGGVGETGSEAGSDIESETGEGSSTPEPVTAGSACDEASITALQAGIDADTYAAVPPIYDADYDNVLRPVEIVLLNDDGCSSIATLSDEDSRRLQTAFGSSIDTPSTQIVSEGLMLRLLELDGELALFSNADPRFWTINPEDGAVTANDAFDRPVSGAIEDGDGGAWIVQANGLALDSSSNVDPDASVPARLMRLDDDYTVLDTIDLPFSPMLTGITHVPEGSDYGWALFLSNDLTIGPDDDLYVLNSVTAEMAIVTPDTGDISTLSLDVTYPTAVAYQADQIIVNSGLIVFAEESTTLSEAPGLRAVDLSDGTTTLEMALPAPEGGWVSNPGFINIDDPDAMEGVVMLNWFDIEPVGTGDLIVADPAENRVMVID